jgi:hypothetical protein
MTLASRTPPSSPFAVIYEPKRYPQPDRELTREEAIAQRNRDNMKRLYHARKATRVNSYSDSARSMGRTNSSMAPR